MNDGVGMGVMNTLLTSRPDAVVPVLELRGISKRYGGVQALSDISVSLEAGEVLCIVGENGAGKSTLSAIASGLVEPDTGTIIVAGQEVRLPNPASAEALGIRLAPQELLLCPNLTVAENVMLGNFPRTRLGAVDRRKTRDLASQRLARLGLDDLDLSRRVESLPVVDRAFVQIARALTDGARVLIADEPTAPMSAREADRLLELLAAIRNSGVGLIYVSHRLDEVLHVGDRVIVLRDGRLVDHMSAAEGTRERIVESMLGMRTLAPIETGTSALDGNVRLRLTALATIGTLKNATLDVCAGEIVGVYGIAGSGRDELGAASFGAIPLISGKVEVDGNIVRPGSIKSSIQAGLGYVPAERRTQGLLLERSIMENLTLANLEVLSVGPFLKKSGEVEMSEVWREKIDIRASSIRVLVGNLSGGNQQKVLLARWLLRGSNVLILDEPTRGVDVGSKAEIYSILKDLSRVSQAAILIVSSDIEEVATVCDRAYVMRDGVIVAEISNPSQEQLAYEAYLEEKV